MAFPDLSNVRGPNGGTLHRLSVEQRFWMKVDRSGDCWLWQAGRRHRGYGAFDVSRYGDEARQTSANRAAWELTQGPVPEGMEVCHTCDTPACVRPSHLFLGTHSDNMKDCHAKGRHPNPGPGFRGEGHPGSKVSRDDVRRIRSARETTETVREVAARFGISPSQACRIQKGKRWAHV